MKSRLCRILLPLLCSCMHLQAQDPVYNAFSALDGLAGNTVYCGTQDKFGNLWFGTDKGLSRFDGNRFENISVHEGLPDPEVLDLFADSEGGLWISSFKKNVALRKEGIFFTDKSDSLLAKIALRTSITSIFEDKDGQKWILGKDYEVYIIRHHQLIHKKYQVTLVGLFEANAALYGIYPGGIYRLSPDGDILASLKVEGGGEAPFAGFNSYVFTGKKLLVSARKLTLSEFDGNTFRMLDEHPVLFGRLFEDHKNRCWLTSPDCGAILFSSELKNLHEYQTFLPQKRVNCVVDDHQGGYWFGTIGEGVFRLNSNGAQVYSLSNGDTPVNVTALSIVNRHVVAGDDMGNFYSIGGKNTSIQLSPNVKYNKVRQIIQHPASGIWIGTDHGLFHLQEKASAAMPPSAIKSMLFRKDTLWTGTANMLYALSAPNWQIEARKAPGRITALAVDSDGFLWTGGTNGLKCEKQGYTYNWGQQYEVLNNRILALEQGGAGILWVVTPQDGLIRLNVRNGEPTALEKMAVYFSNAEFSIQSLYCETSGKLWLATNQGVYALNPDLRTEFYGLRDGLTNLEVNCVLVQNDTLWAGTGSGLSCLPLRSTRSIAEVKVHFSGIRYQRNGQAVQRHLQTNDSEKIILPDDARLVELIMDVLDFNGVFNPDYVCEMRQQRPPFQDMTFQNLIDWVNNRFAATPDQNIGRNGLFQLGIDLDAGVYVLRGMARSKAGNHVLYTRPLILVKKPCWYERIWFWLALMILAAYGLYRFIKYRNTVKLMHLQVAELRLMALQAQINPHFIGNSVSAIQQFFYPPDPVKASRYIAIMTRLLRKTMEFSDQHFITLREELEYIQDYLDMAQLRFEHRFEYQITHNVDERNLFPAMILQPLLENATIHGLARSGKTLIAVHFEDQGERIFCTISDNGPGIESTLHAPKTTLPTHKSVGLELIHKKIKTLNALYPYDIQFEIQDRIHEAVPASGTLVTLSMEHILHTSTTDMTRV